MNNVMDIILVMPQPFTDHPSFPEGILKRVLEKEGFRVGILDTPRWQDPREFMRLGRPRLFFAIVPGPVDSVIMNYTPTLKRRREDVYQMNGNAFFPGSPPSVSSRVRPDRCVITLANGIRKAWKDVHVIAGGVETTQRIHAHYDYQQSRIRRSILLDARLDLAVAGMGEIQAVAVARAAAAGIPPGEGEIPGTAVVRSRAPAGPGWVELPAFSDIESSNDRLMEAHMAGARAAMKGQGTVQRHGNRFVLQYPAPEYSTARLDAVYALDYRRRHSRGSAMSPALAMNLFSVTSHRGCAGSCAFCSIARVQGGRVLSRTADAILREIAGLSAHPRWKGIVSDIGGASAEMFGMDSTEETKEHPYLSLLREARKLRSVRKVFVSSGLRFDLMLRHPRLLEEIMRHHSGRFLRVAPEHTHEDVLALMGKPGFGRFREFCRLFRDINRRLSRPIGLAAYIIVGHPGEEQRHLKQMSRRLRDLGVTRLDVQIFTPAPGLRSTAMYVSGRDPEGRTVPVCRDAVELQTRKGMLYALERD